MTVYLYGLILGRSAHLVPAHITGVGTGALRVVACEDEGLSALVSTVERPPQRASLDDIRAHDHALQSVVHHGSTAVAVRFGQTFATDDDIRSHMSERGPRIARVLEEYDGCVEMRLLLAATDADPDAAADTDTARGPGREYLEQLARSVTRPLEGVGLRSVLGPIVKAERVERLGARGVVFSHLITRSDESAYREAVVTLPAFAAARLVGPLPLYSFAGPE